MQECFVTPFTEYSPNTHISGKDSHHRLVQISGVGCAVVFTSDPVKYGHE